MYAAETLEQFESLLRFSGSLDDTDNLDRWEKLGDILKNVYSYDKESDFTKESEENLEDQPKETVIVMEANMHAEHSGETPFEIENDMRVTLKPEKSGKISVQDYVEAIAARYPLLGMAVLEESNREAVEQAALLAIKYSLDHRKVYNWDYLAIMLTVVQYAKDWNKAENSGFWAYIAEQLGYKGSPQIYDALTTAVKIACQTYNRMFVVDLNGDNNYYSTVLAHALSPSKSFYALCEFLVKFYRNNLDCSVYEEDPAIGRMVSVLRDRCQGATIEQDEDIRGNIYGVQAGLKVLITTHPGYMKHFITKALQKIGTLLDGGELPSKEYLDVLLTQWFISKITEPSTLISPTTTIKQITPHIKISTPTYKRTTEIAFSYSRIRVEYVLDDKNEPALRIPSIRLANRDNPMILIHSDGDKVYQQTISIYGNDYAATSEEIIIPLTDICNADFTRLDAVITVGGKQVFASGISLRVKALLFKDGKLQTRKTIDEGNYTLFAPKSVNIKFQGNVERQRRSYFEQLYDIFIEGEGSIFCDGNLLCCARPPEGSLRFRLPQTQLEYVLSGSSYPIYSQADFALTAIGTSESGHVSATLQNGEQLRVQSNDDDTWQFVPPLKNGGYNVTLSDTDSGRVLDEIRFYITDSYAVSFDCSYYLETCEDGNITLEINGEHFELLLEGFGTKARIPFGHGEIHIQIPRIVLLLDGNPPPTEALWKGEISPSSILQVLCPESIPVSLSFGESQISRRSSLGVNGYAIGNAVQAYDGNEDKVSVRLNVAGDKLPIFDVVYKMSLTEQPSFSLSGNILLWLNSQSFIGDKSTTFKFVFTPEIGNPITLFAKQNERVLCDKFPSKSERYSYKILAQSETAFGTAETLLANSYVIFGDKSAVIFRSKILRIGKVLMDGDYIDIKPVYADEITYIGIENLGYTDLSGNYAHYTAKLFFLTRNGKRYFTDLNPVDIYLVSEKARRLHISFDDGEGLFIDKSGDYGVELYKHADPPPEFARYFFMPDFFEYEYSKEML